MKALTLRVSDATYELLRKQAFDQRTSINALIVGTIHHAYVLGDKSETK